MLPPLTMEPRVPRRFKDLAAAAQGKLQGATGIFEFYSDILAGAARPGEEPRKISDIVGGTERVETLGEKYVALKNFGMSDLLFYLRTLQSFGVIRVVSYTETPRRLTDVAIARTKLSQIVVDNTDVKEAAVMISLYAGIVFDTPARHVLMIGSMEESIVGIALNKKFRDASAYNIALSGQALLRASMEGMTAAGGGRPWYEPFGDLSGIIALLGALQVAKIRPSSNRIIGIRALSKIRRQVLKLIDPYGEYMLPRGTLVLELDGLIHERDTDPLTGLNYEKLGVGMAKERGVAWFRGKVPGRAFNALSKVVPALKENKEEISKELNALFNLTFGMELSEG